MDPTNKRSLKIVTHMAEVLSLEEEEFKEMNARYTDEFKKDFRLELDFITQTQNIEKPLPVVEENDTLLRMSKKALKKLHKSLSMKTHPDLNPDGEEEFKKIQHAYDEGDIITLIRTSIKHDVSIDIGEKEKHALMNQIHARRQKLLQKKQSVSWAWCTSKKDEAVRMIVYTHLKISVDEFKKWVADRE